MTDRNIRILLALSVIALAISLIGRPRALSPVPVSDNGIVPPDLLKSIAVEDEILDRPVADLRLDDSRLDLAIGSLAAAAKIKIDVNWKSLAGAGVDRTAPIHIHLHHGTLRQALNWIAESAGGQTTALVHGVEGDAIAFTTGEDLAKDRITEIYNLRPLIAEIDSWTSPKANRPGMFSEDAVDRITKIIRETVAPDSWRDAGGTVGGIREAGGLLIVTQTRSNQREIATLLTRLDAEMRK